MINRTLKSSILSVSYETVSEAGITSKKKQNLPFVAKSSSDDDKYFIANLTGKVLVSVPLAIENTEVYLLTEE